MTSRQVGVDGELMAEWMTGDECVGRVESQRK